MHLDVDWPNGLEGGRVAGCDGVRAYWARQFALMHVRVTPKRFRDEDGRIVVDVLQEQLDSGGEVSASAAVQHCYQLRDGYAFRWRSVTHDARAQGTWLLAFEVPVSLQGDTAPTPLNNKNPDLTRIVLNVAPKGDLPGRRIVSPRDAASGLPTGVISDNADGGFDLSVTSPLVGLDAELTADATISAGTPLGFVFHTITWE